MPERTFAERFFERLGKIDPSEIESFVLRTVRERDFIARIFEALTEGILVVDADLRVSMVNAAARRILRLPPKRRVTGESLLDFLKPSPLREIVEAFVRDPGPIQNQEVELGARLRRIYNVHLLPIGETESGRPPDATALILQDLTPAHEKQARTAQAEKIASLANLTVGVAHEIKNPLNSLSIHAQLLDRIARDLVPRDGGVARTKPPSRKSMKRIVQSCAAIQEEVDRLRQCVDDFIEAARPHKPVLVLNDLNRFVESVVRMADLELEALGIQIEMLLEPDLPAILADERLIQSALRNLLRNAVEAIEAARRPADQRRVTLRTWAVDESVMLEIADTGCGIAREDMPKIFEPYFTTKFDGSGLGLMAVVRIVRDHNGEISVKSEEGAGTTFTVELPVATRRQKLLESA